MEIKTQKKKVVKKKILKKKVLKTKKLKKSASKAEKTPEELEKVSKHLMTLTLCTLMDSHIYTRKTLHTCKLPYLHSCMCSYLHACIHIFIHADIHALRYVLILAIARTRTHTHTHTHITPPTHPHTHPSMPSVCYTQERLETESRALLAAERLRAEQQARQAEEDRDALLLHVLQGLAYACEEQAFSSPTLMFVLPIIKVRDGVC